MQKSFGSRCSPRRAKGSIRTPLKMFRRSLAFQTFQRASTLTRLALRTLLIYLSGRAARQTWLGFSGFEDRPPVLSNLHRAAEHGVDCSCAQADDVFEVAFFENLVEVARSALPHLIKGGLHGDVVVVIVERGWNLAVVTPGAPAALTRIVGFVDYGPAADWVYKGDIRAAKRSIFSEQFVKKSPSRTNGVAAQRHFIRSEGFEDEEEVRLRSAIFKDGSSIFDQSDCRAVDGGVASAEASVTTYLWNQRSRSSAVWSELISLPRGSNSSQDDFSKV